MQVLKVQQGITAQKNIESENYRQNFQFMGRIDSLIEKKDKGAITGRGLCTHISILLWTNFYPYHF